MFDGEKLKVYMKNNTGKLVGMTIGLIFGILVLSLGFWRSVLLIVFIGAGCWFGSKIDSGKNLHSIFDRFNRDHRNH